jgi:hypothetical protein
MQKLLFTFLLLTFSFSLTQAQDEDDEKFFNLGIKGVVNGSWLGNLPTDLQGVQSFSVDRENVKIGFVGGIWGRINLPIKGLYLQPELLISQNGGRYTYQFVPPQIPTATDIKKNITLTNFEFPLSLGYRIPLGPLGLRLNAGGALSTILSAKQKIEATGSLAGAIPNNEQDIKNQLKSLQAALMGGLGLDFSKLSLDFRLQQNLTELYEGYTLTNNPATDALQLDQKSQKVISGQIIIGFKLF